MKYILSSVVSVFTIFAPMQIVNAQAPVITAATPLSASVEQWGKFEVKLDITANWSNPCDYDEIRVNAVFTDPDGQTRAVEGFFMQDHTLNTQSGALSPVGSGAFRLRFSPDKAGTWKYSLSCTNAAGTGTFPEQTFTATTASSAQNKGFVRSNQTNYLHFDNGEQYIPVGENICWQQSNPYLDYTEWLGQLTANGGNYLRLWHCPWGLGIEWENGNNGFSGLRKYKQSNAFYQDWLYDYCAENGIYVMLCLHYHGQVSTQVNPNWSDSPYNSANGGPCPNTWDFFTQAAAKNHVKNRLRYIVARWGYSRNILSWELFNEVDWTDQFAQKKADVSAWHLEMAAFLKNKDPYGHLVTTSYAQENFDPATWNQPDIDFTQTHHYVGTPNLERVLANSLHKYLDEFEKPTLTGEFGLTTTGAGLGDLDPDGIHIHNALWGTLFGGGMGTGMSWWWDNYIEPENLYHHFSGVSAVAGQVPFRQAALSPTPASVAGAPADLSLTPTLGGWGVLADTSFTIANGQVTPTGASLAAFLYGSQWNTQYRRPPVFYVNFPASGQFRVKTGSETGQAPKIAIWLDGVKLLDQNAAAGQTYSINVPAGQHSIRVDNTGTDWITVASYTFSGLGSAVDAYVLRSANQDQLAGWLLNNRYNHEYLKTSGLPPAVNNAILQVAGLQNGNYTVRFFNCETGVQESAQALSVSNGSLSLPLPELLWDRAFVLDAGPLDAAEAANKPFIFNVFPNPVAPGTPLTLDFSTDNNTSLAVTLSDAQGRALQTLHRGDTAAGPQQLSLTLPAELPAGVYWIKTESSDGKVGMKGISVLR